MTKQIPSRRLPSGASKAAAERGSALVEFLFASALLIVPLLLGTAGIGQNLVRANLVTGVCRDAAHMYAYGVDLSTTSGKNLLVQLAQGLDFTASAGNGTILLSTITYIDDQDCTAAGYTANSSSCPNLYKTVFTRRVVVGNSNLTTSAFGTPSSSIMTTDGSITRQNYLQDSSAIASGFSSLIPLVSGQYAYMAEMYVSSPIYNPFGSGGVSSRSIF
jgi:hypothetical protein